MPHMPDHIVATAFHIIPKSYTSTIQTTYLDQTFDEQGYEDLYENMGQSILIRLAQENGRFGFIMKRQVQLDGIRKCLIKFSKSGRYFAIMLQSENILNIFSSKNLNKMFDKIETQSAKLHLKIRNPDKFGLTKRVLFD